jgi:ATP-dependent 26S proteasome regulatory subunit
LLSGAVLAQVVLSFEQIASPYLGETETMLAEVFDLITRMDGAVLFIDEVMTHGRVGEMENWGFKN